MDVPRRDDLIVKKWNDENNSLANLWQVSQKRKEEKEERRWEEREEAREKKRERKTSVTILKRQFGSLWPVTSLSERHGTGNSTPSSLRFNFCIVTQNAVKFRGGTSNALPCASSSQLRLPKHLRGCILV